MISIIRTYEELCDIDSYADRYEYLKLDGNIGDVTFGHDRYLNQMLYSSPQWRALRRDIIVRDNACEMGLEGFEIKGSVYVHHMNPITPEDIKHGSEFVWDPRYLICVSYKMHSAITYSKHVPPPMPFIIERRKNDTCPWRD